MSTKDCSKWLIIDGLPELNQAEDYTTYATALENGAKLVSDNGSKIRPIVYIPHDKKKTKYDDETVIDGCAFIQFGSEQDANEFKNHYGELNKTLASLTNLQCYTWSDVEKYERLPDKYERLTKDTFQSSRNLHWWLLDEDGKLAFRDQFVIRYSSAAFQETCIFWMDKNQVKTGRVLCYDAADLKAERKEMTRQYVKWSPNGLYLLTTHAQGIQLWGGPQWKSFQKLQHSRVDQMAFSPKETFLITCNAAQLQDDNGRPQKPKLKIWDVLTGDLIIDVPYNTIGPAMKLRLPGWWPVFKFSHDEKYIAKINSSKGMNAKPKDLNKINIFEINCVDENAIEGRFKIGKLGGKSMTVENLFNIEFSPTENILAYTCFADKSNNQSKVTLMQIPSKNSLRVQTLGFDVKKAHLYWQSQGRYLAINMAHSQSRSSILIKSHSIGIISVKAKNMPFSRTDVSGDEKLGIVAYFSWEPEGDRFAIIHGGTKRVEPHVSIYRVQGGSSVDKGSSRLICKLKKRRCNRLYWSPKGGRLVIANVDMARRAGGELEFLDVGKIRNARDEPDTVKDLMHENMTDIEWDPSGRYLITATTQYLESNSGDDTRYVIWSYQGERLFEHKIKYFYQILWRPRPRALERLSKKDKQSVNNQLSAGLSVKFRQFDYEETAALVNEKVLANQAKLKRYEAKMRSMQSMSKDIRAQRAKLIGTITTQYTTKTIQQTLDKSSTNYYITRDAMRKILNDEVDDFHKFYNNEYGD